MAKQVDQIILYNFKENEEDIIKGRRKSIRILTEWNSAANFFLRILLAALTSSPDSFIGHVIA